MDISKNQYRSTRGQPAHLTVPSNYFKGLTCDMTSSSLENNSSGPNFVRHSKSSWALIRRIRAISRFLQTLITFFSDCRSLSNFSMILMFSSFFCFFDESTSTCRLFSLDNLQDQPYITYAHFQAFMVFRKYQYIIKNPKTFTLVSIEVSA